MGKKSGGGGGGGTSSQKVEPWAGQEPFLRDLYKKAERTYLDVPSSFYPGQTYANLSPETQQAISQMSNPENMGVTDASRQNLIDTMSGKYLYGGEGFNKALQAAKNRILPDIQSRYARAGRFGSGLGREAEARAIADAFASQYGNERGLQQQATLLGPQTYAQGVGGIAGLSRQAGSIKEAQSQEAIDEAIRRHEFAQNNPWNRLSNYASIIYGSGSPGSTTQTSPYAGSRAAGALGGAIGGAYLGTQIPAVGPLAGAVGGGLLGGLF